MATVTGFTADRMLEIEQTTVVDGDVVGDNLLLYTREGTPIDAGNVRGPKGDKGDTGDAGTDGTDGVTHIIQDEGLVQTPRAALNFTGGGITLTDESANNRINVSVPAVLPRHGIQDEGTVRPSEPNLNFVGLGVAAADDAANNRTNVTIPGIYPMTYWYYDAAAMESGAIGTSWSTWWSANISVVSGHVYEFGWQNQTFHRAASGGGGASARVVYDGPDSGSIQLNATDIYIPLPNILIPIEHRSYRKVTATGSALVTWQLQQPWWSGVACYISQDGGHPRVLWVRDMGTN